MKTVIFVRHGKSSWEYGVSDQDRPLQERGINDAHLVSAEFKSLAKDIDSAYSSSANRALHTCIVFLRTFNYPLEKLKISDQLYDFSGEAVMSFIKQLDDNFNKVMIFGHNYALTNVVNQWGNKAIENVPTSALVQISFDVSNWQAIKNGTTEHVLIPKHLR
ncbi:histidine phosphatase family protein [uncultured Eudoraea sp.]|uniref:SixA phosphatase family protein n=1 Tax=uncultured Eudoraea sp. TaxID=1035614 RepID=UPI002634F597|nr:histidine phosphatase family protein [uncultured Eudoraea sp.]